VPPDGLLGDGEPAGPVVGPDERVDLAGREVKGPVVDPLRFDELELPRELRLEADEHDAAICAVVFEDTVGQHGAVAGAAPDDPVVARYAGDPARRMRCCVGRWRRAGT
jgi:hypothetical protein